jgi:hypothetical protein
MLFYTINQKGVIIMIIMTTDTKTIGIQSLQIGLNILEVLALEKEPLKFTQGRKGNFRVFRFLKKFQKTNNIDNPF